MFDFLFHNKELLETIMGRFTSLFLPIFLIVFILSFGFYSLEGYFKLQRNKYRHWMFFDNKSLKCSNPKYRDFVLLLTMPGVYLIEKDTGSLFRFFLRFISIWMTPYSLFMFALVFIFEAIIAFAVHARNEFTKP